jgi:MoaA/NifB/PqqE/SkfB family radical SAM enzyme
MRHGYARIDRSLRERLFHRTGLDLTNPAFVQCTLTDRCNYKCQYCMHWRLNTYPEEMDASDWKGAIQSLRGFINPLLIDFSGGEPTIYPHFLELVEFCNSNNVDWIITTNGSSLSKDRFVKRLVAASPLKIDVSVDSASKNVHDGARGVPGSLERIEQGLSALIAERNSSGKRFPIRIKVTVHRLNASKLAPIVHWAKRIGATSIDFNPVRLWREEEINTLSIKDRHQIDVLQAEVEKLIKLKLEGAPIETSVDGLQGLLSHFSDSLEFGKARCRDPLRNFLIGPSGDVKVCGCSLPIGNIKRQSAKEIWHNKEAKLARLASLQCSLTIAVAKGTTSCTAHRSILDDVRRALMILRQQSN